MHDVVHFRLDVFEYMSSRSRTSTLKITISWGT